MHKAPAWKKWIKHHQSEIGIAVILCALLVKFFWTLVAFRMPLGFDAGLYRYLFVRHADGFPPFVIAPMDPWARAHPLGLFFFTSILLKFGLPVSWLLGWIWNLFPVLLAATFAFVIGKRDGRIVGVLVLFAALLSISYFDGFVAMYWKTYVSLLWCVVTYRLIEKKSYWAILTGMLTVATHHQTGLLFGLAFSTWFILRFIDDLRRGKKFVVRDLLLPFVIGVCVLAIGLLWYLPVWQGAIADQWKLLLAGETNVGGNFPSALFYIRTEGIFLALGAVGFGLSLLKERWTLWQLSVLWSFIFVAGHLLFFRRFFLQFDFFLWPFVALAMQTFWMQYRTSKKHHIARTVNRSILIAAVGVQLLTMASVISMNAPILNEKDVIAVNAFKDHLPADALILGLDNESVTLLRGWMPYAHVGGPGLFESAWTYDQWKSFILGTHDDRVSLASTLPPHAYVYDSANFQLYYRSAANTFLSDPCFQRTEYQGLYEVVCR